MQFGRELGLSRLAARNGRALRLRGRFWPGFGRSTYLQNDPVEKLGIARLVESGPGFGDCGQIRLRCSHG